MKKIERTFEVELKTTQASYIIKSRINLISKRTFVEDQNGIGRTSVEVERIALTQ